MIGLLATPIKLQLGPLVNGLVIMESFIPAPTLNFPGLKSMLDRYQAKAPALGIDPLGYGFTPFAYAAGEVLAQAVEATKASITPSSPTTSTPTVLDRRGRNFLREGRRMDEVAPVLHPVPGRDRQ